MKKDIIILAAGVGSRLRPLTDHIPKTMVEVNGQSIISRLLRQIKSGASDEVNIFIVSGYKSTVLESHVGSLDIDVTMIENEDYATTNNMYSLMLGLKETRKENGLVIVNADCVYDDAIVSAILKEEETCIAIDKHIFNEESMKVVVEDGLIKGISKKHENSENTFVSIDIYSFNVRGKEQLTEIVANTISNGDLNSWTEVGIDELARMEDSKIKPMDILESKWMEIDNLEDLELAKSKFEQ